MKKFKLNSTAWLGLAVAGVSIIKMWLESKNEDAVREVMKLELKDEIIKELTSKKN